MSVPRSICPAVLFLALASAAAAAAGQYETVPALEAAHRVRAAMREATTAPASRPDVSFPPRPH